MEELDDDGNVETEEDLDRKEFLDNLYLSLKAGGGKPVPGENDFVLFVEVLMSAGDE